MNSKEEIIKKIRHIEFLEIIVFVIIILIIFILIFNYNNLNKKHLQKQKNRLVEFLDNHEIFDSHLRQKNDFYWSLNTLAWDSLGEKYGRTYINVPLFQFIRKGLWGWDEDRLQNRFDYNTIMEEYFFKDFNFWNTEGKKRLKKLFPEEEIFWDTEKRMRNIIKDEKKISDFFANLLINKATFLKTILRKYDIHVDSRLVLSVPDSIEIIKGAPIWELYKFLNDSTRNPFGFIVSYYGSHAKLQDIQDMYDWVCDIVFTTYVKDKFICYDPNIFNNPLNYSAYITKLKKENEVLNAKINKLPDQPLYINPPFIQFSIDILWFYRLALWLLLLPLTYFIRNLAQYHMYWINKLRSLSNKKDFSEFEIPNFINIFFLKCNDKSIFYGYIILISITILTIIIFNFIHYEIIFISVLGVVLVLIPILPIIFFIVKIWHSSKS